MNLNHSMAIVLVVMLNFCTVANAAPSADLWSFWQASSESNIKAIDHSEWQRFLDQYLIHEHPSGINLIKYQKVSSKAKKVLATYIATLESIRIREYAKNEQMAYWINLYNAKTVSLVLEKFPIKSITDIRFGWFSFGPWDEKILKVEGNDLSLNDIEHRILRPIWRDCRIHYVVNCASLGCPSLAATAFSSANLETLLNQSAVDYINHPRGVKIVGKDLVLSEIYDWYRVDFGDSKSDLLKHLKLYANPQLLEQLNAFSGKIDFNYDWNLNQE